MIPSLVCLLLMRIFIIFKLNVFPDNLEKSEFVAVEFTERQVLLTCSS